MLGRFIELDAKCAELRQRLSLNMKSLEKSSFKMKRRKERRTKNYSNFIKKM